MWRLLRVADTLLPGHSHGPLLGGGCAEVVLVGARVPDEECCWRCVTGAHRALNAYFTQATFRRNGA
eukprot:3784098-Pyramimonas_sp.AAC.1